MSECNRTKWFELDNIFITQKSKYDWNTIIQKPTERKFDFEHGLTIKGIVNSDLKDPSSAKVNMTSITSQINEVSGLNLKKEFLFENVLAVDSTKIYFAVLDKNNKKMEQKTYSQLVTDFNKFMKPFVPTIDCDYATNTISNNKFSLPKFQKAILLDSVAILTKKNKLNYDSRNGNNNGRGFKITEKDEMSYRDVLRFIASNGYNVSLAGGDVTINGYNNNNFNNRTVRNRNSFFKMGGPAIFIDNLIIQDYNTLQDYSMSNIDEIYLNKNNDVSSMLGYQGTIKIYTKKNTTSSASTSKSEFLLVHNGFQSYKKYLNPKYENYIDDGFLKMGTINWVSNISVNDKGSFYFSIPNLNQKEVKIIIQGIGNDGQIISEIKSVAIP